MTRSQFQIHLSGNTVAPEVIDVIDLFTLLGDFRKAVCVTVGITQDRRAEGEPLISLVGVETGSSKLSLVASATALLGASIITQAVAEDDYSRVPLEAQTALSNVSKLVVQRGWELQFVPDQSGAIRPARISRDHEVPDPAARTMSGTTTIYGRCMRVGGEEPVARIKLTKNQRTITAELTEALAKLLAPRLYEEVGLEGVAQWRTVDWEIVHFQAKRILEYRPAGPVGAFADLAEAAAGRWWSIDAEDFVRKMRSEDDE
jgi:hypothetical protein